MRYFLSIFLIVFLLGCIPDSENPLTNPNKEKIDLSLIGTWFWKDEAECGFIHIGLDEESKLLRLIMLDLDKNGELEMSEYSGHTSLLYGHKYLNLRWVRPEEDEPTGYIFVKYTLNSDSIGIALMDNKVVERAIKGGVIEGNIIKGRWSTTIHITDQQKKLQQFIVQNDKELFSEMNYLPKLEPQNKRFEHMP